MTDKPTHFASDDRLQAAEHLAPRFFAEIIGIDYDDCWISDYSAIGHCFDAREGGEAEVEARPDRIAARNVFGPVTRTATEPPPAAAA